ncbi:Hypp4294 [Branchiostoma lanceolatum]|uniref:Hypp4294 protein n=1 Tax=Branchiostoma lanceolatum TaxID=7740 RepID=A0A8K0EVA4_BRALA|nr:Hypp4294 [Branchiostoma lanceolatum]
MMENSIANKLQNLPVGHSECRMSLRLPLQDNQFVTLISVYAPTRQADPATKEAFYTELRSLRANVNEADKVLLLATSAPEWARTMRFGNEPLDGPEWATVTTL